MKIVGWFMISVLLFSILLFPGCTPQEPSLSLSSTTATNNVSTRCELVATVTDKDGNPVPGVPVRFELASLGQTPIGAPSCHHPLNLVGNESYEREVWVWVESTMCESEYLSPLISDYWKKEKVYTSSDSYVYCYTGGDNGEAKFAYTGIKPGTDTIVVSANVSGYELAKNATITWQYPSLSLSLAFNETAMAEIDVGNYSVLEMKITIDAAKLGGPCLLNIGNSPTNNGAGGDDGNFADDSELDISDGEEGFILKLYANQYHAPPGFVVASLVPVFPTAINTTTWILRVKIADQKMCVHVIENDNTHGTRDVEGEYIFRLGGDDAEAPGGKNDFIYYAAFNGVIRGDLDRTGSGVTKVTFMWRNTWNTPSEWMIP